jgi:hypothetical protein
MDITIGIDNAQMSALVNEDLALRNALYVGAGTLCTFASPDGRKVKAECVFSSAVNDNTLSLFQIPHAPEQ